jgi:hypothetical protein
MSIVVILQCPCRVCWQDHLVALRLIATAFLIAFEGLVL